MRAEVVRQPIHVLVVWSLKIELHRLIQVQVPSQAVGHGGAASAQEAGSASNFSLSAHEVVLMSNSGHSFFSSAHYDNRACLVYLLI